MFSIFLFHLYRVWQKSSLGFCANSLEMALNFKIQFYTFIEHFGGRTKKSVTVLLLKIMKLHSSDV